MSFHDQHNLLKPVVKDGADPGVCCVKDEQSIRIREILRWSDQEFGSLEGKRRFLNGKKEGLK